MNRLPLQDVCGCCKELVKSPTLPLVGLHYTSQHRHQLRLQAPAGKQAKRDKHRADLAVKVLSADILGQSAAVGQVVAPLDGSVDSVL